MNPDQHADYGRAKFLQGSRPVSDIEGADGPLTTVRPSAAAISWARAFDWRYCTVDECYGNSPREDGLSRWCLYDADEDDPPMIEVGFVEEAQYLYEILRFVACFKPCGCRIGTTDRDCPDCNDGEVIR